ncbi:hypothetical protein BGX24_010595 [Mortierella sp. AD032]|nr:hypothetical protein BGX24_010595 [Mortierella sp. AD032]
MTEHLHLPKGPWNSEEIFRAIATHPLEIKTSYSVLVAPVTPPTHSQPPTSSSSAAKSNNGAASTPTAPPPAPARRRQVQQRVTLRENETKTLYLTQDFSPHFADPASAHAAATLYTEQYLHRQRLRSNSSAARPRSKSGTSPELSLLPGSPPPASLVTMQVSSSTTRLSERSCVRTIELHITPSPDATDAHISDTISLKSLTARHIRLPLEGKSVFANGYQSWSTSYLGADETTVFENPNWLYNELTRLALASDRHIFDYPGAKGMLHSNVVTTLRDKCLDPNRAPASPAGASAPKSTPVTPTSTPVPSRNNTVNSHGKTVVSNASSTEGNKVIRTTTTTTTTTTSSSSSSGSGVSGAGGNAIDAAVAEEEEKKEFEPRPEELVLLGSLSEDKAYSYFLMDTNRDSFTILQDCKGKELKANGERWVLKTFICWDTQDTRVWDQYAATWTSYLGDRRHIRSSLSHQLSGWTSWYLHYENINQQVVLQNLSHYAATSSHHQHHSSEVQRRLHGGKREWPGKVFQIDDGYTTVGDWLDYDKTKFPGGMDAIARAIREKGLTPGLWLAPFLVSRKSKIAKEKPHWLAQQPWPPTRRDVNDNEDDSEGDDLSGLGCCGSGINTGRPGGSTRPVHAHPAFSVGAYLLDLENPEVRAHLANVFRVIVQEWGFKMLKLDFLFGAALLPRNGKTRGQLMYEAMQMVRDWAGPDTILLGCGVPLGAGFNLVDFCRIGSDVGPEWDSMQRHFHDREYISCKNSLTSTLSRWAMSGRFFGNDPDAPKIIRVLQPNPSQKDLYLIQVRHQNRTYVVATNLSSKPQTVHLSAIDQIIIRESPPLPISLLPTPPRGSSKHSLFASSKSSLLSNSSSSTLLVFAPTTSIYFQTETGQFGSAAAAYTLQPHASSVFLRILDNHNQLVSTSPATCTIPIPPREDLSVVEILDIQDPNNPTPTTSTTTKEEDAAKHKHLLQQAALLNASFSTSHKHLFPTHPQVHILATTGGHILPTSEIEALSFVHPQNPDAHELNIKWRGNFFPRKMTVWLAWKVNHDHPNKYHKRPWVVNGREAPIVKILQGTGLQVASVTLDL